MQINPWLVRAIAVVLLAPAVCVQASPIPPNLGDWTGTAMYPAGNPANEDGLSVEVLFQSQTPSAGGDAVNGIWEVVCTAPAAPADCGTGGFHPFAGTVFDTGEASLVLTNEEGILLSYVGQFASDFASLTLSGNDADGIPVTASLTQVPEPQTVALIAVGLSGIWCIRRRRTTPG